MPQPTYERTGLWKRSLERRESDAYASERERLRVAYAQFWTNAAQLASRIGADLPGLTLHDEHHFNALWDRADQIAGPELALTPIEVFVLGGAILLHDAANTVAAYDGGRAEVMATPEWSDAVVTARFTDDDQGTGKSDGAIDEGLVLFNTLRTLHAQRAEELGDLSFVNREAGTSVSLIQDDQIRIHLGPLMGLIAASHHWDISALERKLPHLRGALSGHPPTWTIRPIILACLLRCADACQLDQERAPDFLYALLKIRGVSETHWRAQHRLATPIVDVTEPDALIFSSTRPFHVGDADAWWVAYDAIQVAGRELNASNNLLRDLKYPSFSVQRIRGSETPDRLSRHIEVAGWSPVSAEVRITNVDRVVDMFGGEELYGRSCLVVLRELIQNALDAIYLRRELEPQDSEYEGRISVKISEGTEGGEVGYWLQVDDDGLGMSRSVLAGPLIDFGSSYVTSDLAKLERPGLASKSKRRIGKYGIGFFSVFMCSDRVLVSSRPYDEGLDRVKTLSFRKSYALRPVLLNGGQAVFNSKHSTVVSAFLTKSQLDELLLVSKYRDEEFFSLEEAVGLICQTIDVDVYVQGLGNKKTKVHDRNWHSSPTSWLKRVSAKVNAISNGRCEPYYSLAEHMDLVDPEDPSAGLACINYLDTGDSLGLSSVGGLSADLHDEDSADLDYVGVLDCWPEGPRRDADEFRDIVKLSEWANRQVALVKGLGLTSRQYEYVCQRISNLGGDAAPIAVACISEVYKNPDEIADMLVSDERIDVAVSRFGRGNSGRHYFECVEFTGSYLRRNISDEVKYDGHVLYQQRSSYSPFTEIEVGSDVQREGSLLRMVSDVLDARGFVLNLSDSVMKRVGIYRGVSAKRDGLISGMEIQSIVIEISARLK